MMELEGFVPYPYDATTEEQKKGIKTILYGHVIKPGEDFSKLAKMTLEE